MVCFWVDFDLLKLWFSDFYYKYLRIHSFGWCIYVFLYIYGANIVINVLFLKNICDFKT